MPGTTKHSLESAIRKHVLGQKREKQTKGYLERIPTGVFIFDAVTAGRRREAEIGFDCEGMETLWGFANISTKFGV